MNTAPVMPLYSSERVPESAVGTFETLKSKVLAARSLHFEKDSNGCWNSTNLGFYAWIDGCFRIRKGENPSEAEVKEDMMILCGEIEGKHNTQLTISISTLPYEPFYRGANNFQGGYFRHEHWR